MKIISSTSINGSASARFLKNDFHLSNQPTHVTPTLKRLWTHVMVYQKKLTKLYQKPNWNCVFVFLQFQHSHEQLTNRIHLGRMNELIHKRRYHQPTMKNNWSHPRCKCEGEPKYAINILISILSEHMILLSLTTTAWRELFKILNFIIWNQFIDRKSDWFTSSSFNMAHMDTWQSRGTSGAVSILQIVQKI